MFSPHLALVGRARVAGPRHQDQQPTHCSHDDLTIMSNKKEEKRPSRNPPGSLQQAAASLAQIPRQTQTQITNKTNQTTVAGFGHNFPAGKRTQPSTWMGEGIRQE